MAQQHNMFGAWMKRRRSAYDLTQEALAEAVGCSLVTIQKLERGRRRPSQQILTRLADVLGITGAERAAFIRLGRALTREGSPETDPPPGAASHAAGSPLPRPLTPLIGREDDLAALLERLASPEQRLVTLTGPAGVGKTRLALEAANQVAERLPHSVAFIPLAHIRDPSLLAAAIAQSLDATLPAGPPVAALGTMLSGRMQLLVLDNFEQIIAAAPDLVAVLQATPGLRLLVTSRERLHVRGEFVQPIAPLPTPRPDKRLSPEALAAAPAVALFCAIARAAQPAFALSAANAGDVARLCAQLDGLPLAIEIVAAHADLTPRGLLDQFTARLALTLPGPRDLPDRQRTLRAAFAWSYALLEPEARRVFAQLGVFAPGWDVAAAAAVAPAAAHQLAALVRASLVQSGLDGEHHHALLDTVRAFALEQLGAEAEGAQLRHAEHYLGLAARGAEGLRGAEQSAWVARLRRAQPNLELALGWLLETGRHEAAARLAADVQRFWWMRGQLSVGRHWLERVLAVPTPLPAPLLARLWHALGSAELAQGDADRAEQSLRRGLAVSQAAGDPQLISLGAHALGVALGDRQRYDEARALLELALRLDVERGDRRDQAISLGSLGALAYHQRDFVAARALLEQSLALHRAVDDLHSVALTLNNLAELARRGGDDHTAASYLEEAQELMARTESWRMAPYLLNNRALLLARAGRAAEARAALAEAVAVLRETGDRGELVTALLVGARLRLDAGAAETAAQLLGAADRVTADAAIALSPVTLGDRERIAADCARRLGAAHLVLLLHIGGAFTEAEVVALACG
jgi:predicted ATPase/DNA-binding XRE family transcriptional regulator